MSDPAGSDPISAFVLSQTISFIEDFFKGRRLSFSDQLDRLITNDKPSFDLMITELANYHWQFKDASLNEEELIPWLAGMVWRDLVPKLRDTFHNLPIMLEQVSSTGSIVFVIGAGVSFDSKLNWETIIGCLARCLPDKSEEEIEREFRTNGRGGKLWDELERRRAIQNFRDHLKSDVSGKKPRRPHELIADFILADKCRLALCFNWDDFVERVLTNTIQVIVGDQIPSSFTLPILCKPHGCVRFDAVPWVLPNKNVAIPNSIKEALNRVTGSVTILNVGFSGGANFGLSELRALVPGARGIWDIRPVCRPSDPGAMGKAVRIGAKYALERLKDECGV